MNSNSYKTREFNELDLPQLSILFNEVRNKRTNQSYFTKKYSRTWNNEPLLGRLLYCNNELIGFCGATIYTFKDNNEIFYNFAQLGDLIIKKEYQKKGLFKNMLSELEQDAKKRKIDCIIVFPNSASEKIFKKNIKWEVIGCFFKYDFKIKTYPLLKVLNVLNLQNVFYYISSIIGAFKTINRDMINNSMRNQFIGILLSEKYLHYKKYQPYRYLKFKSKLIPWSLSDGILIGASETTTDKELTEELKYLTNYCTYLGVHIFSYFCYSNSLTNQLLSNKKKGSKTVSMYYYEINKSINPDLIVMNSIDRNSF
jgi:GNAT superfamily N-acetyltransferase